MEFCIKPLFIACLALPALIQATTYQGSWYTREQDRHHYFFSWERQYWTNARTTCQRMGGELVAINDNAENAFLESLPESGHHWIGLYARTCSTTSCTNFAWSNGDPITFTDWYSTHPRVGGDYQYVYKNFRSGNWYNQVNDDDETFVCEFEDGCFPNNPCRGNTICQSTLTGTHSCVAASQIDECESSPCVNGRCRDEHDNYTCICENGYEGRNCDQDINECYRQETCIFGTCRNTAGSFSCSCLRGFYGDRCQENTDECVNHRCVNGKCVDGNAEYKCACSTGYTGTYCEQDINECEIPEFCANGECTNTDGGYKCTCSGTFHGERCNLGPNIATNIALSATILTFQVAVAVILVILWIKKFAKFQAKTSNKKSAAHGGKGRKYIANIEQGQNHRDTPETTQNKDDMGAAEEQEVYVNVDRQSVYTHLKR